MEYFDEAATLCERIREKAKDEHGHASLELAIVHWIASHIYL